MFCNTSSVVGVRRPLRQLIVSVAFTFVLAAMGALMPSRAMAITRSQVESTLASIRARDEGTYWTTDGQPADSNGSTSNYYYGIQCKGYANKVFNELFGTGNIGPYSTDKSYIPSPNGATVLYCTVSGTLYTNDEAAVKTAFLSSAPGDFVQMRRRGKTYGHSQIVYDVDDGGVTFLDCNADGHCLIQVYRQTWTTFCSKNDGFSIYRANGYDVTPNNVPRGCVDAVTAGANTVRVSGWAYDPDSPSTSITVHVYIGGPAGSAAEGHVITANKDRSDVNNAFGISGKHGFDETITTSMEGNQNVYLYAIDTAGGNNPQIANGDNSSSVFSVRLGYTPRGCVDSIEPGGNGEIKVKGWAYDPDKSGDSITVHVYVGGPAGSGAECHGITANVDRSDVNSANNISGKHGFDATIKTGREGTQGVYVYALDTDHGNNPLLRNPAGKYEGYNVSVKYSAVSVNDGTYVIRSKIGNRVLDIDAGKITESGANAQIWSPLDNSSQIFVVEYDSATSAYCIKLKESGKLIDAAGGASATITNVAQYNDNGGLGNQRWVLRDAGDGWVYIKNKLGYYLDVEGGSNSNKDGGNVHTYTYNANNSQKWKLIKVSGKVRTQYPEGTYIIRSKLSNKRLDVSSASSAEGAKVQIYRENGGTAQIFRIGWNSTLKTSTLRLKQSANDDRWLDAGKKDGAGDVSQYAGNGGQSQNWFFEDAGDGWYYIRNQYGYYLDVHDATDENGTKVQVYTFNGSNAQKWKPVKVSGVASTKYPTGTYTIRAKVSNKMLDVASASSAEGAKVQTWQEAGTAAQLFRIGYNDSLLSSTLRLKQSANDNLWLDAGKKDGAGAVSQYAGDGSQSQNWHFEDAGGGWYYIRNLYGYYLEVKDGASANGTVVQVAGFAGTDAQKWKPEAPNLAYAGVGSIANQTYTGSAITPTATVTYAGINLTSGSDYTLSYANNQNVGTATVTVKGTGTFTGSKSATFSIVAANMSATTVASIPQQSIDGTSATPKPAVSYNGKTLFEGTDYTLSYKDNNKAGTATVTLTGKGNFTGSKSVTFTVVDVSCAAVGHRWGEWHVDVEPTHQSEGSKSRTCSHCKTTETVPIPMLEGPDLSTDGWVDLAGGKKGYARGGSLVTGWFDLGSSKFYFQPDGSMSTGWTDVEQGGSTMHYYFNPASGNLVRNTWFQIDGVTYYFRPSGNLATGWATISDNGVDKKYYLDADGQLLTGWQDIEVSGNLMHYYFRPSGAMATGWATIDGQKYWFRPSGNMATGWADVDDAYKRYFDSEGHMLTGWQQIGGKTYYFRASGAMQTGKATIDGKEYEFNDKGVLMGEVLAGQSEDEEPDPVDVTEPPVVQVLGSEE